MGNDNQSQFTCSQSEQYSSERMESQLLSEYNALRSEVIHRMQNRHQLVVFSLAVLGAVLAFHAQANTLLAYPILGFFLALGWAHNDFRIGEIGEYVRTHIEAKLPGLNWEQHFFEIKKKGNPFRYVLRATTLSAGGIIVGTQILSIVVILIQNPIHAINKCLLATDGMAIIFTGIVLHWRKILYKENKHLLTMKMKRAVLFIPNSELREHFSTNSRQDIKIVTPAIITKALAEKLNRRGKVVKDEVPLSDISWVHSHDKAPNKICEALDFTNGSEVLSESGPMAISFANEGSIETFHHHNKHWEIYYSYHTIDAKYKLPGVEQIEIKSMDEGGAVIFSPGVEHCMEIHGLTIVLEVPAVKGDREA